MASQTRSGGTFSGWTTSSNAGASDNAYAVNNIAAASNGAYLVATNFGFDLPANARITGVSLKLELKQATGGAITTAIATVTLRYAGALLGAAITPGTALTLSDADYVYGDAADLWSATITPAIVNGSTFGLRYRCSNISAYASQVHCDYIEMTVYYEVKSFRALLGVGA